MAEPGAGQSDLLRCLFHPRCGVGTAAHGAGHPPWDRPPHRMRGRGDQGPAAPLCGAPDRGGHPDRNCH